MKATMFAYSFLTKKNQKKQQETKQTLMSDLVIRQEECEAMIW